MNEAHLDDETTEAARDRGWRGVATVALGIAGLALLLASENLGAGSIYNVTLHFPGIDKIAHVGQDACVFLAVWWLLGREVPSAGQRGAVAAGVTLLLGTSDEVLQRFVADRTFDLVDLAANVVGVLLGVGLAPVVPSQRVARRLIAAAVVAAVGVTAYSYFGLRHLSRGLLYTQQGDLPSALTEYRLALVDDPQNPGVLDTYAWALHRSGRSREARPLLERAFAGKPQMAGIHYHLGEVYAALGDPRAEHHLREQIRLFPGRRETRRAEQTLRRGCWPALEARKTCGPNKMIDDNDGDSQSRPPVRDQPSGRIAGRPLSRPDLR